MDPILFNALTRMMCAAKNQRLVHVRVASASSFTILPQISASCSSMEAVEGMIIDLILDLNVFLHVVSYYKYSNTTLL